MMKKFMMILSLTAISLFVVACGGTSNTDDNPDNLNNVTEDGQNNNQEKDNGTNNDTTDDTTNNDASDTANSDDEVAQMEKLDYIDFELEVAYAKDQEYEVELELTPENNVKAKIEDELNGVKKKGSEAFDELYPLVEKLTIAQDTTKEDAIQEVISVFGLDEAYQKLDVELKFKDGTKLEFKDVK